MVNNPTEVKKEGLPTAPPEANDIGSGKPSPEVGKPLTGPPTPDSAELKEIRSKIQEMPARQEVIQPGAVPTEKPEEPEGQIALSQEQREEQEKQLADLLNEKDADPVALEERMGQST